MSITYEYVTAAQGETLARYTRDKSDVIIIIGPLGSGKTVETCQKIFGLMCSQEPEGNIRKSRWLAIRNTYSDLIGTTIKDWRELYDDLGDYKAGGMSPPCQQLRFQLEDKTIVDSEIIFLALDRPDAVKKLRGYQLTGVWGNELKELGKAVIDMAYARCGRYPSNPTWHGLIGDSNAPDVDHWLYTLAEKEKPQGWAFYKQPGGVLRNGVKPTGRINWVPNPDAENIKNLPPEYYIRNMRGKSDDWISVNLANEYGFVSDGKPIFPEYRDDLHNYPLEFEIGLPVYRGWDFGVPACVLAQLTKRGQLRVVKEFTSTQTMGIDRFADHVKHECAPLYAHKFEFIDVGDPSGNSSSMQKEGTTCFSILHDKDISVQPGKQDPEYRLDSVRYFLNRLVDGLPAFLVDGEQCPVIRRGFQGGYKYRRLQVSGEKFTDKPDKTMESHPHDALQYICGYLRQGESNKDDYHDDWEDSDIGQAGS